MKPEDVLDVTFANMMLYNAILNDPGEDSGEGSGEQIIDFDDL